MRTLSVDASWFGATGIGRFADEVLRRVPASITLKEIRKGASNTSILSPLLLAAGHFRSPSSRAFWSPGFMPPALPSSQWQAITVHDLTHLHHYGFAHKAFYAGVIRPLLRRMALVFTVSEFSRREIVEWSGISPDRVVAIPHGIDPSFCLEGKSLDLGRPYVLYVGNRRSYKNVNRLLAAFANSGLPGQGFLLALSGDEDEELRTLAASLRIGAAVKYLGHIPEADLPATYRGAHAVAFVSLYEGFGFPIIEGMGCGVPVLTSATSSMPEVAGGAALLVQEPENDGEIANALHRICTDDELRGQLKAAGVVRARSFDWDATARAYWNLIEPHC